MALFKRADLEAQGLTKEQAEWVMTESNRALAANYSLKSDIQAQIDAAVAASKPEPVDVKTSEEYLKILAERDMLRAISGDEFSTVKPKFREQVFGMLDRTEKAPAVADQLKAIGEKYEEYFEPENKEEQQPTPGKPSFGAPAQGSAPTGKTGPTFSETWNFVPKNDK